MNDLEKLKGDVANFGAYQSIGDMRITFVDSKVAINITGNCQPSDGSETLDKLFDNNIATKWYGGIITSNVYHIYWAYVKAITIGFFFFFFFFFFLIFFSFFFFFFFFFF
jgi:hypothetical protein